MERPRESPARPRTVRLLADLIEGLRVRPAPRSSWSARVTSRRSRRPQARPPQGPTSRTLCGAADWAPVPNESEIGGNPCRTHCCTIDRVTLQIRTNDPAPGAAPPPPHRASHARGRRFETRRAHLQKPVHLRGLRRLRALPRTRLRRRFRPPWCPTVPSHRLRILVALVAAHRVCVDAQGRMMRSRALSLSRSGRPGGRGRSCGDPLGADRCQSRARRSALGHHDQPPARRARTSKPT